MSWWHAWTISTFDSWFLSLFWNSSGNQMSSSYSFDHFLDLMGLKCPLAGKSRAIFLEVKSLYTTGLVQYLHHLQNHTGHQKEVCQNFCKAIQWSPFWQVYSSTDATIPPVSWYSSVINEFFVWCLDSHWWSSGHYYEHLSPQHRFWTQSIGFMSPTSIRMQKEIQTSSVHLQLVSQFCLAASSTIPTNNQVMLSCQPCSTVHFTLALTWCSLRTSTQVHQNTIDIRWADPPIYIRLADPPNLCFTQS